MEVIRVGDPHPPRLHGWFVVGDPSAKPMTGDELAAKLRRDYRLVGEPAG